MDDYEVEESIGSELVDRLSELPLGLILYVLSFLPMRDVVATTFLSKMWKNLWTIVPFLNFRIDCMGYNDRDQNFLNRVLMLWKGGRVLKFGIDVESHFYVSAASDMDSWVSFAVENKVEDLSIDLSYDLQEMDWFDIEMVIENHEEDVYTAPECLYSCSSIRKLRLVGCNLGMSGSPSWNQLTSLVIDGYCFSTSSINLIMSGSPKLEVFELCLLENFEDLNIVSTSLKKLKIEKNLYSNQDDPSVWTELRICCPNLETVEILGALYSECVFTDVSSLTDATIGFYDLYFCAAWLGEGDKLLANTVSQILNAIQPVVKLTLSYCCVKVFRKSKRRHLLSPLQNVTFLKLDARGIGVGEMTALLGIFPNVEMLVVDVSFLTPPENYSEFEANLPKPFLHQLKTFEIFSSLYLFSELWFFEFLLKRASVLDKLVIRVEHVESRLQDRFSEFAEKLKSMPRSSPTAKVIFKRT